SKRKIGDRKTDDGVDSPCVQAPMEKRVAHREPCRFRRLRRSAMRGIHIVTQRFSCTPKHKTDAHAGAEQHSKPTPVGIFGLVGVCAQLDLSKTTKRQEDRKHEKGKSSQE